MTDDALKWLEDWYSDQCDGDWEHQNGIDIGNIDNPGWTLKVDLTGTSLENIPFEEFCITTMTRSFGGDAGETHASFMPCAALATSVR